MEELIKEKINEPAKVVDIEEVIMENRRQAQEDLQKAAEAAKEARLAKYQAEDEALFQAFNAGVKRRMVEAMNQAAAEQMAKADAQIIEMFKASKPAANVQPVVRVSKKRRNAHSELEAGAYWFIGIVLFLWLIARLLGMA